MNGRSDYYKWLKIDIGSGSILDCHTAIKFGLCNDVEDALAIIFSDKKLITDIHSLIGENSSIGEILVALYECSAIQGYSYNPVKYVGDQFVELLYNRGDLGTLVEQPQKKLRKDLALWLKYIRAIQFLNVPETLEYCMHQYVITQEALYTNRILREHKLTVPVCLHQLSDVDFAQIYNDINAAVFIATGGFNCFDVADILSVIGG